jgi:hypothetical protein
MQVMRGVIQTFDSHYAGNIFFRLKIPEGVGTAANNIKRQLY